MKRSASAQSGGFGRIESSAYGRWTAAGACAFCVAIMCCAVMPRLNLEKVPPKKSDHFVCLESGFFSQTEDGSGIDLSAFFDDAPLFLPTIWNYAPPMEKIPTPKGWDMASNKSAPVAEEIGRDAFAVSDATPPLKLETTVLRGNFANFARGKRPSGTSVPDANGTYSIVDMASGKTVRSGKIPVPAKMVSPAEFTVSIDSFGWSDIPVLRQTSSSDSADASIAKMLTTTGLLNGLPEGGYRATVSP